MLCEVLTWIVFALVMMTPPAAIYAAYRLEI